MLAIAIPLELRQLKADPKQIGLTLGMFGFGMFAFEWLWGIIADRIGYRIPLLVSLVLFAACIVLLAQADSVLPIAISYFLASGMLVAAGPIGRSFLGTTLPAGVRATSLAVLSAGWVIGGAIGAGAGGQLLDHIPIRSVLLIAAAFPLLAALIIVWTFRGYSDSHRISMSGEDNARPEGAPGGGVIRVLVVTAAIVLLIQLGAGGETALLPLLVTSHLHLSASTAGWAMFAAGLVGGVLLVPGGMASDRWGRRGTMIAGGILSAIGFMIYAVAGAFGPVILGAVVRGLGASLIWPAATAWISESSPRRRHALVMGLFGEFENVGITLGPVLGGLAWSIAGIQSAFVTYAAAALLAAGVAALAVERRTQQGRPQPERV